MGIVLGIVLFALFSANTAITGVISSLVGFGYFVWLESTQGATRQAGLGREMPTPPGVSAP